MSVPLQEHQDIFRMLSCGTLLLPGETVTGRHSSARGKVTVKVVPCPGVRSTAHRRQVQSVCPEDAWAHHRLSSNLLLLPDQPCTYRIAILCHSVECTAAHAAEAVWARSQIVVEGSLEY